MTKRPNIGHVKYCSVISNNKNQRPPLKKTEPRASVMKIILTKGLGLKFLTVVSLFNIRVDFNQRYFLCEVSFLALY